MMSPEEKTYHDFQIINQVIINPRFLNMEGLSGDIPFWIASYDVRVEVQVEQEIKNLLTKITNQGIESACVDLFELSCEIIEENVGMNELAEIELSMEKEYFSEALQSIINVHERFIPAIKERVDQGNPRVLFLKGVGKVYPFIRSHIVLNNLQSVVKHIPTVMFYPGEYSGITLRLFNLLEDDNYYRASN